MRHNVAKKIGTSKNLLATASVVRSPANHFPSFVVGSFSGSSWRIRYLTAPYQIASDQFRFRYRTVEGTSYVEFPGQTSFLKSLANPLGRHRLITVTQCDDTKVVMLPPLPYQALFLDNNMLDEIGFRRLPALKFESVSLTASTKYGR
jgi:hypothetical protein